MTPSNPKPPAAPPRKLVLRRIAERPALPVVRPPPRPSYASLDVARPQAGSLPPVAATWPPPVGESRGPAARRRAWSNRPTWIACGVAAAGAIIAVTAGLTVRPAPRASAAAAVPVRATRPLSTSEHAARPALGSTPWIEVPVYGAPGAASAIPASALPVARPNAGPRALARTATTSTAIPSASSPSPPSILSAPAESASVSVLTAPRAPAGAPAKPSAPPNPAPKTAPTPKAADEEMPGQPSLAPSP